MEEIEKSFLWWLRDEVKIVYWGRRVPRLHRGVTKNKQNINRCPTTCCHVDIYAKWMVAVLFQHRLKD